MNTKTSQGGTTLAKSATVHTNDPDHSKILLKVKGRVEKTVSIVPSRVRLTGHVGEALSQAVIITPETDNPFKIVKVSATKGVDFSYDIKEKDQFDKKVYVLTVTNTRKEQGRYFDNISIKTDSKIVGTLSITVMGNLKSAEKTEAHSASEPK